MIRHYKITALGVETDHDYMATPVKITKFTKVTLEGGLKKKDTVYLYIPYTENLRLGQTMETNFHIEELLGAPAKVDDGHAAAERAQGVE